MFSKKLIALICIMFVVGLLIGVVSFRNDLISYKSIPIESNIVQAYFKVYNVTQDSGIGFGKMVSYVVVLNITNPSDNLVSLSSVTLALAQNGTRNGNSVNLNSILNYQRDFSERNTDHFVYPHTSRLIPFSQTGFMPEVGLNFLNQQHTALFYAYVSCVGLDGHGSGDAIIFKQLSLTALSQDEFMYGTTFSAGNFFFFNDYDLGISFSGGQER